MKEICIFFSFVHVAHKNPLWGS